MLTNYLINMMHHIVILSQEWSIIRKSHIMKRTLMVTTKANHQRRSNNTHHRRKICLNLNIIFPQIPKQQTIKKMFRRMRYVNDNNWLLQTTIITKKRMLRYNRHLYPPLKATLTRFLKTTPTRNISMRSATT